MIKGGRKMAKGPVYMVFNPDGTTKIPLAEKPSLLYTEKEVMRKTLQDQEIRQINKNIAKIEKQIRELKKTM